MKNCSFCGHEVSENAEFCPQCGRTIKGENQSNYSRNGDVDAPSFGYAILGFFLPLVGLILYLVWMNEYPLRAKSCGKGALVSVIISTVIGTCVLIAYFAMLIPFVIR